MNKNYADPDGKTFGQLYIMLFKVYRAYPEYHEKGLTAMVKLFAGDDFYNMHFVAKAYLKSCEQLDNGEAL